MLSFGDGIEILPGRHRRIGRLRHRLQPEPGADLVGQRLVDVEQMRHHPLADHRRLHLAEFEGQRRGDVMLLARGSG